MIKILEGIVGSTAYGLATPESDVDKLGIYVEPTRELLKLYADDWRRHTVQEHNPDGTWHEARKYCRLALTCNPSVLELLWLPADLYTIQKRFGVQLIRIRDAFLSAEHVRCSYLGYATAQVGRMGRGTNTEKNARHVYRLLYQGYQLYATGELPVRLEDPERFMEFGRQAVANPQVARDMLADYERKFNSAKTPLPERPDVATVEVWLGYVRRNFLLAVKENS